MTLTLELSSQTERRLRAVADTRGQSPEMVALEALDALPEVPQPLTASTLARLNELISATPDNRVKAGVTPLPDDAVAQAYADYHDARTGA